MKKYRSLVFIIVFMFILAGCSSNKVKEPKVEPIKEVKVFMPEGLPALTMTKMMKDSLKIKDVNISYEVQSTSDNLVTKVLNSEADIAVVPSNLAAQAYNKGLKYLVAGTGGWGSLYLISNENIKSWSDLKGKEIYSIGKGLTPDIMFRYILNSNKIDPDKDLKITYLNAATELAPAFISGKSTLCVIPEPMLTTVMMKKTDTKILFDLNKEWINLTGSKLGYPQSTLIIKNDLIEKNKAFVDEFIKAYDESINWANNNRDKLGSYIEELKLNINKSVAEKALDRANLKFVNSKDSKEAYEKYYNVLQSFEPKSIGGKVPDEGLFLYK